MKKFTNFTAHVVALLLFQINVHSFAQKQANTWYFGDMAGIKFTNGSPVAITNGQIPLVDCPNSCHSEGTAVMSDSTGSLLFYTNGQTVWNKSHAVMPNGNNLLGHPSSTQSSLIVPKPGSKRYYYIFTTPGYQFNFQDGFRYSVVDMCAENGMGDVVSTQKNIKLLDTIAEKLTGIFHNNGTDYWIIVHKYFSRNFYAYQLTSTGITNTVITAIGNRHPLNNNAIGPAISQMKASPDGQKIAVVNANTGTNVAEYFSFNKTTGVLSNSVNINATLVVPFYGVSFSPDNSKLYIASPEGGPTAPPGLKGIWQYNVNAGGGNPDSVRASKYKFGSMQGFYGMQLATNGKIYIARGPLGTSKYLSAINNPNNAGAACNFIDSAVNVTKVVSFGLPNFIDSFNYIEVQTGNDACSTPTVGDVGIGENSINENNISPNPFNNFLRINTNQISNQEFKLFNLFGKLVYHSAVPEDGIIHFDGVTISTGIYFYQLADAKSSIVVRQGKVVRE